MTAHRRKVQEKATASADAAMLAGAVAQARVDAQAFVTLVSRFVSYKDFFQVMNERGEVEIVPADAYLAALLAAIYDLFSGLPEPERAAKAGLSVEQLHRARAHQLYQPIREKLLATAKEFALPRTFDQWAEKAEDLMARDNLTAAIVARDPRTQHAAIQAILDRRSAKKGREGDQVVVLVPDRLLHELQAGMRTPVAALEDGGIDASVLNVPRLIGSGSTEDAK